MRETIEFRIPEEAARSVLAPDDGTVLGTTVRKIELSPTDSRYSRIRDAEAEYRTRGESFFTSYRLARHYSKQELDSAELLRLSIKRVFEPAGEECGTRYSDSEACRICGAGRRQVGDLRLDLRTLPKRVDFARSIADEWVVSQRLAELILDENLTGVDLGRVLHRSAPAEAIDLSSVPAGRDLIAAAEAHGISADSGEYWVWLNRAENHAAFEVARAEAKLFEKATRLPPRDLPAWYQLQVGSAPVRVAPPTRFGTDIFDDDPQGTYRCPLGHVAGLNLLSEVSVRREHQPETDFAITHEHVGDRRGVLRPAPLLLVTQRVRTALIEHEIKGYDLEVVHLIDD